MPPASNNEPAWKLTIAGIAVLIATTIGVGKELWAKADKGEVELLRVAITEISAKQREDNVIQKNILSLLEKMDARMGKIEDNQSWQIQQEVKRLQWQSFKQEPQPSPQNNVNR